jgi:hypothetical protein
MVNEAFFWIVRIFSFGLSKELNSNILAKSDFQKKQ